MSAIDEPGIAPANAEAIEAWDGPLFERFVRFRHLLVGNLVPHGDAALAVHPPRPGERAIDIGCGFGDSARQIGELVGPEGSVVGVDAAPRFIAAAREETTAPNVELRVADVESEPLGGPYDYAFSRFGTMFFANPVAALRNVRASLAPDGRLVMVVWRAKVENDWVQGPLDVVESFVRKPDEYEEPTCGPGPFSMANADTTSGILKAAGYTDISLRRCDLPMVVGTDVDEAVAMVMSIGPAGEILRLQGDRAAHLHDDIRAALREVFEGFRQPDGTVAAQSSTWIVSARPG